MNGKHIEIFLVDGVPGGMTTAEIAGWTGHVLASERSSLGALCGGLKRSETAPTSSCPTILTRLPAFALISGVLRTLRGDSCPCRTQVS